MKSKKIIILLIVMCILTGCTNIKKFSYDDIMNKLSTKPKPANTYRKGYKFFVPNGLQLTSAGTNYAVLSSSVNNYYLYFDLTSYNSSKDIEYNNGNSSSYFRKISYDGKKGYVDIKLSKNNQYLIEIVYNYAKIEVMVDKENINTVLMNSINILNSVKYDKEVITKMLEDDNFTYTEETFDLFEKKKKNSDVLDYVEDEVVEDDVITDTDFLN